ncbi:hypothetical protein ACWEQL_28980 [Kitasatospora sp. NPDC004240]
MSTTELNERLLEAGAVLAPGALADAGRPDSAADVLTARAYRHPVLGERRVVRLVPRALGPAEDLAVDFLGLTPDGEPAEVGQVRQEALGFPAWALVHDPANGHHALALVKEMERLARQAKAKPGAAKEAFDELAARLGRAVPHFLPTFCEEVGRIFLEQGNQTYAAAYFGKAREAERTHSLAVDEERLRAVFLEFALAGALTVKALRQYVKELSVRLDPVTAWQRFRQLCTERSAAGMAPYAGVAEDTRALLRAAGLDRDEHERALLAELLASPAVNRAPAAFWKTWHGAIVELARRDESVRARLLELLPVPGGSDDTGHDTAWLAVLADSGAEAALTGPRAEGAEPAAAWLQRWTNHIGRGWRDHPVHAATLALAGRMAERLRADGVPVDLFRDVRASNTQLDLLDLLLTEGVPVADPADRHHFRLGQWAAQAGPGSPALAAVAADPRFRPALRVAVPGSWTALEAAGPLAARPALRELFVEWADERADELLAAPGLAGAAELLQALRPLRAAIVAENPAAGERIASLDVSALLARTLRGGILDELGWPALEEALIRLGAEPADAPGRRPKPAGLIIQDAWPNLVLAREDRAVVVGPRGILLEHTLRHPKDEHRFPRMRYSDGELLVAWYEEGKQRAYWSNRPTETFELEGSEIARYWGGGDEPNEPSLPLPGGGRTTGERPLHAGDTRMPAEYQVFSDGTGHWVVRYDGRGLALTEYDPATGEHGDAGTPPRIAASAAPGAGTLDVQRSRLLPVQPGLEESPLGTDGTVLGHWVRAKDGRLTTTTVDGHTLVLPATGNYPDRHLVARLALPGDPGPLVAQENRGGVTLGLPAPAGDGTAERTLELTPCRPGELAAAGTALVPPLLYWHALRPRSEQGSLLLRGLTDEQSARLVDAAWPVDAEPAEAAPGGVVPAEEPAAPEPRWITVQGVRRKLPSGNQAHPVPVTAVGEVLPELGHPLLLAGVAGVARTAANLLREAAHFVPQPEAERRAGDAAAAYEPEHGRDHEIRQAVEPVLPDLDGFGNGWDSGDHWRVVNNLRAVTAVLADPPPAGDDWAAVRKVAVRGGGHHGWLRLLGRTDLLAFAAAAPLTPPEARATLALLLGELTAGPLADRGATLREAVLTEPHDKAATARHTDRKGEVWRAGGRTVVIVGRLREEDGKVHWLAADHDPSGAFGPVAHFGLDRERSTEERHPTAWTVRFTELLAEHGPRQVEPATAETFGELTGIGATRAILLLALPVNLNNWYGNALDAERLKEFGLKNAEANAARGWLRGVPRAGLAAVWAAMLPAEPALLWSEGPDVTAAAAVWCERIGRVLTLPAEEQATVNGASIQAIEAVLNHARTPWLSRTTVQRLRTVDGSTERQLHAEDPAALPSNGNLAETLRALRWLAYRLPYGSPLRAALPGAVAALRRRLADPELLLDYDLYWAATGNTALAPLLRAHFGLPEEGGAEADGLVRCGPALLLGPGRYGETVFLRPAGLTGADDPVLGLLEGLARGYWFTHEMPALQAVLSGELDRLAGPEGAAAPEDPARREEPAEGWPHDPRLSVPDLVTEVAKTRELGEDAAVLYLQLLALPDPTDRNVARWTGWKPARLKRARAELAASGLVLEAKRARAGRGLFLPGGWQEAKAPGLPAETWKAGLYPLPDRIAVLPHLPVPELFTRAWQRVTEGDAPGYEELRTSKRRKATRR